MYRTDDLFILCEFMNERQGNNPRQTRRESFSDTTTTYGDADVMDCESWLRPSQLWQHKNVAPRKVLQLQRQPRSQEEKGNNEIHRCLYGGKRKEMSLKACPYGFGR